MCGEQREMVKNRWCEVNNEKVDVKVMKNRWWKVNNKEVKVKNRWYEEVKELKNNEGVNDVKNRWYEEVNKVEVNVKNGVKDEDVKNEEAVV